MSTYFHGTAAKDEIIYAGFNTSMVFLTSRRDVAEDYGFDVIEVCVNDDDLLIDLDQAGAVGVSVATANCMTGNDFESAREYAENGYSVCVKSENVISIR